MRDTLCSQVLFWWNHADKQKNKEIDKWKLNGRRRARQMAVTKRTETGQKEEEQKGLEKNNKTEKKIITIIRIRL